MTPSEELFKLIKSLSKNEKRYFSMYSSVNAKQQLQTKLFDIISNLETYDEEIVKKKLGKTIDNKRLSSEKVYLFNLILKSIRQYKSESSDVAQTRNYITDLYELYDRGLYRSCVRMLQKAEQHSYDMDQLNTIFELKIVTIRFMNGSVKFREIFGNSYEQVESELADVSHELFIHAKLYTAHRRLFGLQMRNSIPAIIRTQPEFSEINAQLNALEHSFTSTINKKFFLQCRSLIHFFNENLDDALEDQKVILEILNDGRMKRSHLKQKSFIQISCNAAFLMIEKDSLDEAEQLINTVLSMEAEFEQLPPAMKYQGVVLPRVQLVEISIRRRDFARAKEIANDLDQYIDYDITQITSNAPNIVLSTILEARIVNQEYRKANRVLNKLKQIPEVSRSRSLRLPIYETIIHFEQNNVELIPGIIRNFTKVSKKENLGSPWINHFFEFVQELISARPAEANVKRKLTKLTTTTDINLASTIKSLQLNEMAERWASKHVTK